MLVQRTTRKTVSMMTMAKCLSLTLVLASAFFLAPSGVRAAGAGTLKIAALTPQGTTWADGLKQVAKQVETATAGRVQFKLYLGGVAGDEPDVIRKIRVGQLSGGIFTGKSMGDLFGDVRLLEVPFNFGGEQKKVAKVVKDLRPHFDQGLEKAGFVNLGFFQAGNVYFVSKKKAGSIADLKGLKIWAWEGDALVQAMVETLNLVSVPLALPDVLNSLSTGIIDAAYATPLAIMALQWQSKIEYLIDFPITYAFASFLIDAKAWAKIEPKDQEIVKKVVGDYIDAANVQTAKENEESLATLKSMGVKFLQFPAEDVARSQKVRADLLAKVSGKMFSPEVIELFKKSAQ